MQVLEQAAAPSNAAHTQQDSQEARYVVLHSNKKRQTPAGVSGNNVDDEGQTPSTSVALIILYSITGIITALFLLIIVTGAIRAHRHPERYGPRPAARFGPPRQSRAKGLARAVLDTLPIVPFGANREDREKPPDIEMHDQITNASVESPQPRPATKEGPPVATEGGLVGIASSAPIDQPAGSREEPDEPATQPDLDLNQCPVCLEDFEEGQEVRVLPCHHNFHPDCIDPWLLNVSGSCPMWYVSRLDPTVTHAVICFVVLVESTSTRYRRRSPNKLKRSQKTIHLRTRSNIIATPDSRGILTWPGGQVGTSAWRRCDNCEKKTDGQCVRTNHGIVGSN